MKKYLFIIFYITSSLHPFMPMSQFKFQEYHHHETERTTIRTLTYSDVADMFEWCRDARVTTWLTWSAHKTKARTYAYAKIIIEGQKQGKPKWWAVVDKKTKKVIGISGFHEWNSKHKKAELGIVLSPQYWGQGYATEMIRSLVEFAFKTTDIHRIEAIVAIGNKGSCRVFEKLGFRNEGCLRDYKLLKGKFIDHYLYSLIRSDFSLKKTFES